MSGINTSSRETEAEARKLVALGKLQVAWPSRDQGAAEMRLALYLEQLLPYSPESVEAACSAWMRTGSRFPTLADLVALVEPIERRRPSSSTANSRKASSLATFGTGSTQLMPMRIAQGRWRAAYSRATSPK
jgi:hypothetical protein